MVQFVSFINTIRQFSSIFYHEFMNCLFCWQCEWLGFSTSNTPLADAKPYSRVLEPVLILPLPLFPLINPSRIWSKMSLNTDHKKKDPEWKWLTFTVRNMVSCLPEHCGAWMNTLQLLTAFQYQGAWEGLSIWLALMVSWYSATHAVARRLVNT